ncbi:MAG: DUF4834 family protein [Prevotella sp.]|nr:DUF4834 family protein [Prevotella sp.]
MAFFLQFIFFIVLFFIIGVAIMCFVLYQHVKQFLGFGRSRHHHTYYYNGARGPYQDMNGRQSTGNAEPTVIDQRSQRESGKKIIPENEGEYVEFEEA